MGKRKISCKEVKQQRKKGIKQKERKKERKE